MIRDDEILVLKELLNLYREELRIFQVESLIFMTKEAEEDFGTGKFSRHQKFLWDLVEHSESSTMAQIVSIMSMSFVGVSIVGMIVNTLEATQYTVYCFHIPPDYGSK